MTRVLLALTLIAGLFVAQPPTPVSAGQISGLCDQEPVRDVRNDGAIDIVSIQLTSDCRSFQFTLTTRRPFTNEDLGRWGIRIGPGFACDGMKNEIVVRRDSSTGELIADIYRLTFIVNNPCAWQTTRGRASVERLSPRSLRVTVRVSSSDLPNRDGFRWISYATHSTKATVDTAPRFAAQALPTLKAPRVEGWTYDHTPTMQIEWSRSLDDPVDRYEYQYRLPGGRWSDIRRAGPYESRAVIRDLTYATYEVRVRVVSLSRRSPWGTGQVQLCPKSSDNQTVCS